MLIQILRQCDIREDTFESTNVTDPTTAQPIIFVDEQAMERYVRHRALRKKK
jgi:hypothetical protein